MSTSILAHYPHRRAAHGLHRCGDCGGYIAVWDPTNSKLKVYHYNYDAADGPAIEVPNATDLSTVTVKGLLISQ